MVFFLSTSTSCLVQDFLALAGCGCLFVVLMKLVTWYGWLGVNVESSVNPVTDLLSFLTQVLINSHEEIVDGIP